MSGRGAGDRRGHDCRARGRLWAPGEPRNDPRWTKPLPWRIWVEGYFRPSAILLAGGLALVNLVLPLGCLRLLAGGRHGVRMWVLMVVPVAAAVPLVTYQALAPWLPAGPGRLLESGSRVFWTASVAGVPIVLCAVWVGVSLVRLRWKSMLGLAALTVAATLVVAGVWVWRDRKSMAAIEHYGWEGWYSVVMLGAYVATLVWVSARVILGGYRLVRRGRGAVAGAAGTSAGATPPAPPS